MTCEVTFGICSLSLCMALVVGAVGVLEVSADGGERVDDVRAMREGPGGERLDGGVGGSRGRWRVMTCEVTFGVCSLGLCMTLVGLVERALVECALM